MNWLATVDGGLHAQGRHNSKLRCLVMHDDALVDGSWLTLPPAVRMVAGRVDQQTHFTIFKLARRHLSAMLQI